MKSFKLLALIVISGFITVMFSCDSAKQKVTNAEENVVEAEQELQEAEDDYLADVEKHRMMYSERITANEQSIAEFNARVAEEKKEVKADYQNKIKELELKNSDMKKKMDEYKADGKDGWEKFKTEFDKDMDNLGNAITEFGNKK
ncbi:MAG: hypothetical protein IPN79_19520 [Saprospiraceae bacterium]|nr:hypothetical protein [Saprospiraceae bacterium]